MMNTLISRSIFARMSKTHASHWTQQIDRRHRQTHILKFGHAIYRSIDLHASDFREVRLSHFCASLQSNCEASNLSNSFFYIIQPNHRKQSMKKSPKKNKKERKHYSKHRRANRTHKSTNTVDCPIACVCASTHPRYLVFSGGSGDGIAGGDDHEAEYRLGGDVQAAVQHSLGVAI